MSRSRKPSSHDNNALPRLDAENISHRIKAYSTLSLSLPVEAVKDKIIDAYSKYNGALLVVGETGSGKTTKIPQYILEHLSKKNENANSKMIVITQPRRVAAISLARRVSEELGAELGSLVGFSVRFEECWTQGKTKILFMTDGMLLKECVANPDLTRFSCIVLDEVHERTLRTDILLGLIKRRLLKTALPVLGLVIMSATVDAEKFQSFLPQLHVMHIPGRQFPVRIWYASEPQLDYLEACLITICQIHRSKQRGDILCFLTGQEEIDFAQRMIEEHMTAITGTADAGDSTSAPLLIKCCPIYASMPAHQQMAAFRPAPPGYRKLILATNIAETSITIPGVRFVIDPGFVKQRYFNAKTGMESLVVVPCSQASSKQRAGRAGREAPGECYRLYPEECFDRLNQDALPEISRTSLSNIVLQIMSAGVEDVLDFDFLDRPDDESLRRAMEELVALGAICKKTDGKEFKFRLTETGQVMSQAPLTPMLSRCLIEASSLHCSLPMCAILAMLSADSPIFQYDTRDEKNTNDITSSSSTTWISMFKDPSSDHLTLLNVFKGYYAERFDKSFMNLNDNKQTNSSIASCSASADAWCKRHHVDQRTMRTVLDIFTQLVQFALRHGLVDETFINLLKLRPVEALSVDNREALLQALCTGHLLQVACKQTDVLNRVIQGSYKLMIGKQIVHIHPSSVLFSHGNKASNNQPQKSSYKRPFNSLPSSSDSNAIIIYHELTVTTRNYMRTCTSIPGDLFRQVITTRIKQQQ